MQDGPSRSDGQDLLARLNAVLEALSKSSAPIQYKIVTHGTYDTARTTLQAFSSLGWLGVTLGGIAFFVAFVGGGRNPGIAFLALPVGLALLIGGILTVVQCQAARAAVDSADYARQSLEILAMRSVEQQKPNASVPGK